MAKLLNFEAIAAEEQNFAFASDNMAGAHPKVLEYVLAANTGYAAAYHNDLISVQTFKLLLEKFEFPADSAVVWAPTGTAANVLALSQLSRPGTAVVCANQAHITTDEAGSPEVIARLKIKEVPTLDGKLNPADPLQKPHFDLILSDIDVERKAQAAILSISQTTEMGTVFSLQELKSLREFCDKHKWIFHLDGSRMSNAAAHLNVKLSEIVQYFDVVSFGFSKNGAMDCEAVVFRPSALGGRPKAEFKRLVKSHMCIVSKSRFIASQALAMLDGDLWFDNAKHANTTCARLLQELRAIGLVTDANLVCPSQANAIIVRLPNPLIEKLRDGFEFYDWLKGTEESQVRFMTSWQTAPTDVDAFVAHAKEVLGGTPKPRSHPRRYHLR